MGREKKKCSVEGCERGTVSLGKRGGRSYYSTRCKEHRKQKRNKAYRNSLNKDRTLIIN